MATEITIPRLGWSADDAVFAGWLKRDGDAVAAGDALFSLETDKATEDIESLDAGILRIPPDGPKPGDRLAVGTVIGQLGEAGETASVARVLHSAANGESASPPAAAPAAAVRQPAARPPAPARGLPAVSPRARRAAAELGVDWKQLSGTGRTGRIREQDVRAAAASSVTVTESAAAPVGSVSTIRRAIAEKMLASARSTAPVTLTTTADADNLAALRRQFQAVAGAGQPVPSYADFLLKLVASALSAHPLLNSQWREGEIVGSPEVHIGIAVDTDAGLLVPVIRGAARLTLRQIAAQSQDLISRARQRKLKAEEMQGGTFTITNLGAFGIDAFTPIINYPECAILGIGRIVEQPVVRDGQIVPGRRMTLSLTFDHRIVDGAPAARFLQALVALVEIPAPALLS